MTDCSPGNDGSQTANTQYSFDTDSWTADFAKWLLTPMPDYREQTGEEFIRSRVYGEFSKVQVDEIVQNIRFELSERFAKGKYEHRDDKQLRGYIRHIARAQVSQYIAEQKHLAQHAPVEDYMQDKAPGPDNKVMAQERQTQLETVVREHLNSMGRRGKVIELFFFEDKTFQEIAAELGITEETVRKDKSRALKVLRNSSLIMYWDMLNW